jgi:alpha-galactosidase
MPIAWNEESRELYLSNELASYVMRVLGDGSLGHVYFGPALPSGQPFGHLPPHAFKTFSEWAFVDRIGDSVAFEYPTTGTGDYRAPALVIRDPDGSKTIRLEYVGHRITKGKPVSKALPMTYVESDDESDTVDVVLADSLGGTEVTLTYTVRKDLPVITRSARIRNRGDSALWFETRASGTPSRRS